MNVGQIFGIIALFCGTSPVFFGSTKRFRITGLVYAICGLIGVVGPWLKEKRTIKEREIRNVEFVQVDTIITKSSSDVPDTTYTIKYIP